MRIKTVSYDFEIDSLVSVDAPTGTDPDTLIEEAKRKLIDRILSDDITLVFDTTYDCDSGEYSNEWQVK